MIKWQISLHFKTFFLMLFISDFWWSYFSYYDIFHVTITDTNNTLYFSHHVNPCLIGFNHLIVFETNRIIIVSRNQSTFACRSIHLVSPLPPSFRPLLTSCRGVPLRSWIVSLFRCQRSIVALLRKKTERPGFKPSTLGAVGGRIIPLDHDAPKLETYI